MILTNYTKPISKLVWILPSIPITAPKTPLHPSSCFFSLHLYMFSLSKFPNPWYPLPSSLVSHTVWDTTSPLLAAHQKPLSITFKDPSAYISKSQYPIPLASFGGLKLIIQSLSSKWLLCFTSSHYNTIINTYIIHYIPYFTLMPNLLYFFYKSTWLLSKQIRPFYLT